MKDGSIPEAWKLLRGSLLIFSIALCVALPEGLAAQSAAFLGLQSTFVSGLYSPGYVAVDNAGNAFVLEDGQIDEYLAGTSTIAFSKSLSYPAEIAIDPAGNIYVGVGSSGSTLVEFPQEDLFDAPITVASNFGGIGGLAADNAGNIYVADYVKDQVWKIEGGSQSLVPISGLGTPYGLAVDSSGTLYVGDYSNQRVIKLTSGGSQTTVSSSVQPSEIAVDSLGNLFISENVVNHQVVEVPAGSSSSTTPTVLPISGLSEPYGLAVDQAGNLLVADAGDSRVVEFQTRTANFGSPNVCPAGQTTPPPCSETLSFGVAEQNVLLGQKVTFVASIVTEGVPGQDFELSSDSCQLEGPSRYNCTFTITFAPLVSGPRRGAVQITAGSGGPILLTVPLFGNGLAAQAAFNSIIQSTIPASGLINPSAVAFDGAGDLYIVDTNNNRVVKIPAGGGAQTTLSTGSATLSNPLGVAVDGAGNVYIADYGNQRVLKVPPGGQAVTAIGSGVAVSGVTVDQQGNVFIADYANNRVLEYPVGGAPSLTVANGADNLRQPRGLALDGAGNLYIASSGNSLVVKVPLSGLPASALGSGWSSPFGVAIDAAGSVYVADYGQTSIIDLPAAGGTAISLGSGLSNPTGLAVDGMGNIVVADYDAGKVLEYPRAEPPSFSFASTKVGSTSKDSPQSFTLQSIGNSNRVFYLGQISFPPDFPQYQTDSGGCVSNLILMNGAVCSLSVNFEPLSASPLSESLVISSNQLNSNSTTQTVTLTGTGLASNVPATLTAPAPGSILTSSSVTFTWGSSTGATGYALWLGSTGVGSGNLYEGGVHNVNTLTLSGLPVNGETLYARLWTSFNGTLVHNDYTFTAASLEATLTSPAPGSTFTGTSATFTWTAVSGAAGYAVWIGSTGVGSHNLLEGGFHTATSVTFSAFPINGETIYMRLWTSIGGTQESVDYTFKAASQAALTSPAPGSVLPGPSATFSWTTVSGSGGYALWLGTTGVGSHNLLEGGIHSTSSVTFSALPANGGTVYARLFTSLGGALVYTDYTYTAAMQAVMTSPAPGGVFSGASIKFTWAAGGSTATGYALWLGSTGVGSGNLYEGGVHPTTSVTVNSLPTNGEKIYARLWTNFNGVLTSTDYVYTAQ